MRWRLQGLDAGTVRVQAANRHLHPDTGSVAATNLKSPALHSTPMSTICTCVVPELTRLGAVCIDGDKLAHKVYLPGQPAFDRLVSAFGPDIVAPSGDIDRRRLGAKVFGNKEALERLNAIVWPVLPDLVVEVCAGAFDLSHCSFLAFWA